MIGLDTNILVRYITQDDEVQAASVNELINKYISKPQSMFINDIVICELVWVLSKGYKYQKEQIINVLRQFLTITEFAFENQNILWQALEEYEQKNLDFSDALISKINQSYSFIETFTLDEAASHSSGFTLLHIANRKPIF